jgi:hypothetical protein
VLSTWGLLLIIQLKNAITDETTLGTLISIGRNGINAIASPKVGRNVCLSAVVPPMVDFLNVLPDGRSDMPSRRSEVVFSVEG